MSYHTKACQRFLDYLINQFNITKPVHLSIEEDIALNGYNYKGYPEVRHPMGTAQNFDTHCEIKLSLKMNKNRAWLLSTLAHEFGHIVQFSEGRYLTPGTDWELEAEASRITTPYYREYLRLNYPKTYKLLAKLGKPSDPPEWVQEKMDKVQEVHKENMQQQMPVEQRYQLVSYNGEVYKIPL